MKSIEGLNQMVEREEKLVQAQVDAFLQIRAFVNLVARYRRRRKSR